MKNPPWDQRIARVLVRPLVQTPVTPNQITALTLIGALAGAGLLAQGGGSAANWGAGLFVLSRFLDHFDGELARQKNMKSRLGYYFDYITGGLSYAALFFAIGWGLKAGALGSWAVILGSIGAAIAITSMFLNLGIDKAAKLEDGDATRYPSIAGFELEDGIYLLAPITWLGWLEPFFVLCGAGAGVYGLWTLLTLLKTRRQ